MEGPRILVVEDEGIVAKDIEECLVALGYTVCGIAGSADEAVRAAAATSPDLVLMDLMLRGRSDGVAAAAEIRQRFGTPVVYLTAYGDVQTVRRAKQGDPFGYVLKPFNVRDLQSAIEIALYRHGIESRLAESEAHLRLAMDVGRLGTWDLDVGRSEIRIGGHSATLIGLVPEARLVAYDVFLAMLHPDDRATFDDAVLRAVDERSELEVECRLLEPHGARWLAARGRYYGDDSATRAGIVAVLQDVTESRRAEAERLRLEAEAHEARKDQSLGVLAAGVAHDFNNILVTILGNAELALMQLPRDSAARETITQVVSSAKRAADLTRQMLAYTGQGRHVVAPVNLSGVVGGLAARIGTLSSGVTYRFALTDGLPPVRADLEQMRLVVLNLATNAAEAVAEREGVVLIATSLEPVGREALATAVTGADLPEREYVFLRVLDTGPGIDDATRPRIFEPFFSTKFLGRGLGLSAVLGIVRAHGGAMWVGSGPDGGAMLTIALPPIEE